MKSVEENLHVYNGLYTHLHWGKKGYDARGNSWFSC
jgi:hypothetical protein